VDYRNTVKKLHQFFVDDPLVIEIVRDDRVDFFEWLRVDYRYIKGDKKHGKGVPTPLGKKSVLNVHINLSAYYTWLVEVHHFPENLIRSIRIVEPAPKVADPLTESEVKAMLEACNKSALYKNRNTRNTRPTAKRDRTIILVLLDTGARASELCGAKYKDLNIANSSMLVHGKGSGQEPKDRSWRHLYPERYFGPRRF